MSTVNCHEARALLMAYLDSELDAVTIVSLREHLDVCSSCGERFEQEERLERALNKLLAHGKMPDDVHGRLNQSLVIVAAEVERDLDSSSRDGAAEIAVADSARAAAGVPAGPALASLQDKRRTDTSFGASTNRWMLLAAAAVVLLSAMLYVADDGVDRDEAPAYLGSFVSAWESAAEQTAPPQVQGVPAVRGLLDKHAFAAFQFPQSGRVHDHAVKLLGAREESFDGVRAVNLLYDCCGALTSVFVLPTQALDALPDGLEALKVPGSGDGADLEIDGVHTYTVVRDGLLIGVVSRHASGLAGQWASSS